MCFLCVLDTVQWWDTRPYISQLESQAGPSHPVLWAQSPSAAPGADWAQSPCAARYNGNWLIVCLFPHIHAASLGFLVQTNKASADGSDPHEAWTSIVHTSMPSPHPITHPMMRHDGVLHAQKIAEVECLKAWAGSAW